MGLHKAWLRWSLKELKTERGYRHIDNPLYARTEEITGSEGAQKRNLTQYGRRPVRVGFLEEMKL